jgi:hypothetical protein
MAMLQKRHMHPPSQGWCGRNKARIVGNSFVQGMGTACSEKLYLLMLGSAGSIGEFSEPDNKFGGVHIYLTWKTPYAAYSG